MVYNEFEERFSASTTVTCYLSTELTNIDSSQNPDPLDLLDRKCSGPTWPPR